MREMKFTKMVASGNDFVVTEVKGQNSKIKGLNVLAKNICHRKYGIGADGLLVLEQSKKADIRMRIFNADGSEAEMCGNGARCTALFVGSRCKKIETKAGIIETKVNKDIVKIKLTEPKNTKLNIPLQVNNRNIKVNFINTGVPHTVIFTEGLKKIDIVSLGRQIRYHHKFAPSGTNVDFVEVLDNNSIGLRTYERGVEDETLACGTGSVASALIFASLRPSSVIRHPSSVIHQVNVLTQSGETLKVYFERRENNYKNVWLEGRARIVYKGVYNV